MAGDGSAPHLCRINLPPSLEASNWFHATPASGPASPASGVRDTPHLAALQLGKLPPALNPPAQAAEPPPEPHAESRLLLLLLASSQLLTTDWTGGVWLLKRAVSQPLLFLWSHYSTTGPTHSPRRSFTVIHLEPARYSLLNRQLQYRLALCLKQGFDEG